MNSTALESRVSDRFAALVAADTYRSLFERLQRTGRPTKLTADLISQLVDEYTLAPIGRDAVCDKIGISDDTRRRWIREGEADEAAGLITAASTFCGVFKSARGYWQSVLLQGVMVSGPQWVAYMTLLERIWPEQFSRRQDSNDAPKVQVILGVQGERVQVNVIAPSLSPAEHNNLAQLSTGQVMHEGLIIRDYVNQSDSVPALESPAEAVPARDLPRDPAGEGMAPVQAHGAEAVKGRRRGGKGKRG